MKQSSNICRHSAKRIKTFFNQEKDQLLSPTQARPHPFPQEHKCDYIKLPQFISHMDRANIQEHGTAKLKCKEFHEKQRLINLSRCGGFPLNPQDQEAVSTQCCVNQKHVNHFFLMEGKNAHDTFSRRSIRRGFREYLLASKQFKSMASHVYFNVKKYQIAVLKDENSEDKSKEIKPIDWMPVKTEERHFLMGHTIKHP
ncbi:MAG TPA: hypothetical protein VGJ00_02670 [Rhabdochlamydiaceae bacterium]|jgi:hypothetical protein